MSTPKTLSTGTLSLKFMQNAQRAKQQQQVELERAAVKDEAEWEVPLAVRQAWGLSERNSASSAGDACVVISRSDLTIAHFIITSQAGGYM